MSRWRRFLLWLGYERRKVEDPTRCTWAFPSGVCTRCGLTVFDKLKVHVAMCPEYGGQTLHHTLMAMGPKCVPWPHVERRVR